MSKIKILVVEDEIIIADNICDILNELGYDALEPALNYSQAIKSLEEDSPDIAILDINLSGQKDGVDVAWRIKEDFDIPFIFLTSNADVGTIEKAKKVDPPAYLVKPFNKDELFASIEIALHNFVKRKTSNSTDENLVIKNSLFIKQKQAFQKLKFEEILYLKSDHVYIEIYSNRDKKYLVRGSMSEYLEKLPSNFFRAHRSFIVNLDFLESISSSSLLISNDEIPIGKNYREELLKRVNLG